MTNVSAGQALMHGFPIVDLFNKKRAIKCEDARAYPPCLKKRRKQHPPSEKPPVWDSQNRGREPCWWVEKQRLKTKSRIRCTLCNVVGSNVFMRQKHVKRKHGKGVQAKFKCVKCGVESDDGDIMEDHMRLSHPSTLWHCQFADCTKAANRHSGPRHSKKFICKLCCAMYQSEDALADHEYTVHELHDEARAAMLRSFQPVSNIANFRRINTAVGVFAEDVVTDSPPVRNKFITAKPMSLDQKRIHIKQFARRMADIRLQTITKQVVKLGILVQNSVRDRESDAKAAKIAPMIDMLSKMFVFSNKKVSV